MAIAMTPLLVRRLTHFARPLGLCRLHPTLKGTRTNASATVPKPSAKKKVESLSAADTSGGPKVYHERLLDGEVEVLTAEEKAEKDRLIKELTRRLSGPLADEHGNVPTGKDRPIAIEVDGPSHFYANSKRYTAYTKLKHRLLSRMGYKVLHVPFFEWRRLRGARERENYMREKLREEPTEWLDPEDAKLYQEGLEQAMSVEKKDAVQAEPSVEMPPTPPSPPRRVQPQPSSAPQVPLRDPPHSVLHSPQPEAKSTLGHSQRKFPPLPPPPPPGRKPPVLKFDHLRTQPPSPPPRPVQARRPQAVNLPSYPPPPPTRPRT